MQEPIIVIQAGDTPGAGITVSYFDTLEEATRHIEARLEAGCSRDSINSYRATRLAMQITQKPVVSLADSSGVPVPPQYAADAPEGPAGEVRIPHLAANDLTPRAD
jgi:hypothetical protein